MGSAYATTIYNDKFVDKPKGNSLWKYAKYFFQSCSTTIDVEIRLPRNIFLRTKTICNYIESQLDETFGVEDFIFTLYEDFINRSVRQYNPKKLYDLVTQSYDNHDTITLIFGDETYEYPRTNIQYTEIVFSMGKEEVNNGTLLLSEIYDLYGVSVNFDKMMTNIWVNFIEEYKRGDCNKALRQIIKMLKKNC